MKRLVPIALCLMLLLTAGCASALTITPETLCVNGTTIDNAFCCNSDGAVCIALLPAADAMGYLTETAELIDGDAYRVVHTLYPPTDGGFELMVAYSIVDGMPIAEAFSKDQMSLPLQQSMTLLGGNPYLPCEFFETGMCCTFTMDSEASVLYMDAIVP